MRRGRKSRWGTPGHSKSTDKGEAEDEEQSWKKLKDVSVPKGTSEPRARFTEAASRLQWRAQSILQRPPPQRPRR